MDDNRVSVIVVDIIHIANTDIQLEIVEKLSRYIRQMLHDVRGQLDERTSTSFQINSINLPIFFFFNKMMTAHVSVTYIELRTAVWAGLLM